MPLRTIAALVLPDVAPFEYGVIAEVFGIDRTEDGVPPMEFRVCGPEAGVPLPMSVGAMLTPAHGLDGLEGVDLVAVAATKMREFPPEVLKAVRSAADAGATILSVCSGVFVLGAAGLLDGRRCTSHWHTVDELRERVPLTTIDPDVLFVEDGPIITSAGTAAGIDACLHLVRRELGSVVVNKIARRMVVPPQRDGGQRQYVEQPVPECRSDSLTGVLDHVVSHLDEEHAIADLARLARMSDRTFARRFVAETGTTPHRWITGQRVLRARQLLEATDLSIDEVAHEAGFGTGALLRHHFRASVGVSPADYRRTFQS